jgi:hypothetical protein
MPTVSLICTAVLRVTDPKVMLAEFRQSSSQPVAAVIAWDPAEDEHRYEVGNKIAMTYENGQGKSLDEDATVDAQEVPPTAEAERDDAEAELVAMRGRIHDRLAFLQSKKLKCEQQFDFEGTRSVLIAIVELRMLLDTPEPASTQA